MNLTRVQAQRKNVKLSQNRLFIVFMVCMALLVPTAQARTSYTIALLYDFDQDTRDPSAQLYVDELDTLIGSEFKLNYKEFFIDWSKEDLAGQLKVIYQDSQIDMLLVQGLAANQVAISLRSFPKPTFLPYVVERDLIQAPFQASEFGKANTSGKTSTSGKTNEAGDNSASSRNGVSGKRNLSYLSYSTQLFETLDELQSVVPFKKIAILGDSTLLRVLPTELLKSTVPTKNLSLQVLAHTGEESDLLAKLEPDVDAVMFGHLPRFSPSELDELIEQLTERGLPSFSYLEEGLVERGLLATPLNNSLSLFAARRNALNMQAVMLGEPASQQPVLVEAKAKLTINQATAERLGIAIDFRVLVDAHVLGFGSDLTRSKYSLAEIASMALKQNLQLKDQRFNLQIQENERRIAKTDLFPKLSAGGSYTKRKDDGSQVLAGFANEESTDVSLNLSQSVYSDSRLANYQIQGLLSDASSSQLKQAELDIVREASLALADVLQAQSEAAIQQENLNFSEKNLELAVDRVSLGASTSADQYRWETQVANAKSAVFQSFSRVLISKQNLNRILNLKITDNLEVDDIDMDESMVFGVDELFKLMDNTHSFELAYEYGLQQAYARSPEISQLRSLIDVKKRELRTLKRQNWLPELSLNGQLTDNLDNSGLQADGQDTRDWQLMLNAQIPLFQGGQIRAQAERSKLELAQLDNQLSLLKQQLAQQLRTSMNNLLTSLFNLQFSNTAATSAKRSLSLVTDSYSKGAVSIVDLLDAQNSSISAGLARIQAYIGFFRSMVEMQRAIGVFEFLLSADEKQQIRSQLGSLLNHQGDK